MWSVKVTINDQPSITNGPVLDIYYKFETQFRAILWRNAFIDICETTELVNKMSVGEPIQF